MKIKLTLRVLEGLTCPPNKKDVLHSVIGHPRFYVRVTNKAKPGSLEGMNYLTKPPGQQKIPLGSCAEITPVQAIEAHRVIMGEAAKGVDVAGNRKKAKAEARRKAEAGTLDGFIADWQALHLADKKPRYAVEAVRTLRRVFSRNLGAPPGDLSRATIVKTLDAMKRNGSPDMARTTARYGSALYGWGMKRERIAVNPFVNLSVTPTTRRERTLSDDELLALWHATSGVGPFNSIVRMLILTGQRLNEVAGMAWAELSDDLMVWTLPGVRTKNNRTHVVPLPEPARKLLRNTLRHSGLVFPGLRGSFLGWGKAKKALDSQSGVTDWRLHDLRRTTATGLQRLGVRLEVTEAVLNHISGSRAGIVGIYQRHDWNAEKRAALETWGGHISAIVEGRTPIDNVVPIAKKS